MFFIKTNVDGCIIGNYFAEEIDSLEAANEILEEVRHGDPNAEIVEIKTLEKKER